jgi:hypothetical protein
MISRGTLRAISPRLTSFLIALLLVAFMGVHVAQADAQALDQAESVVHVDRAVHVHHPGVPNILTPHQIALAAQKAGFSGENLVTAVAVAMAESSRDANVVNSINAYGLWQVLAAAHPDLISSEDPDQSGWCDPYVNATFAWKISSGGKNWRPWQVYTTGAYQKYIGEARSAVDSILNDPQAVTASPVI